MSSLCWWQVQLRYVPWGLPFDTVTAISAAFLEAVGLSSSGELIKWRTRREVLEWLDTFVKEPKGGELLGCFPHRV